MTGQLINKFPPIDGSDTTSFAAFTIKNRLPVIIDRIIEDNEYPVAIVKNLMGLKYDMLSTNIYRHIKTGNDKYNWNEWLQPQLGKSWLEAPFYFVEAYFYRLILDIIDFQATAMDPFARQKQEDLSANFGVISTIMEDYKSFLNVNPTKDQILKKLFYTVLWGNKADLSQLNLTREKSDATDATIIDDLNFAVPLFETPLRRVDIILDNSGVELFTDVLMAEKLVTLGWVHRAVLHAKAYPTFVSDATLEDIKYLLNVPGYRVNTLTEELFQSIHTLVKKEHITFNSHEFWNSPLHFYDLPHELENELEKSDLVILKGDANYRRVFGDRKLPHELTSADFTNYLPSRSIAIRILKSELLVGMDHNHLVNMRQKDRNWLINGKYGIIQLLK